MASSAPRTRRCSDHGAASRLRGAVGSAHAEVFQCQRIPTGSLICRLRARGGVPAPLRNMSRPPASAPRTRRCSEVVQLLPVGHAVGSAHAEVFRDPYCRADTPGCRLRACGGVPRRPKRSAAARRSVPRTRRCSVPRHLHAHRRVDSAPAGVVPPSCRDAAPSRRGHRIRGGGPDDAVGLGLVQDRSGPHVPARTRAPGRVMLNHGGCSPYEDADSVHDVPGNRQDAIDSHSPALRSRLYWSRERCQRTSRPAKRRSSTLAATWE